jgi:BMFP domain-containing protein YqiC
MINKQVIEDLSQRLSELLPAARELQAESRTRIEQMLNRAFSELNLVTEEEFSSQVAALQRAQQRISDLEAEIQALNARLDTLDSGGE